MLKQAHPSKLAFVLGIGALYVASAALSGAQTTTTTTVKPKPAVVPPKPVPAAARPVVAPKPATVPPVAVRPATVQPPVAVRPATVQPPVALKPASVQPVAASPVTAQPAVAHATTLQPSTASPVTTTGAATSQAAPQYQQASPQYYQQAAPAQQQYASQPGTTAGGTAGSGGQVLGANTMQGVLAGIGSFKYGDVTALAMSCMRSGTRVFCDYDETRQSSGNLQAGWAFSGVQLVLAGGRIATVSNSFYVDSDGSTFQTASINPTNPVRLMLEYDNIPVQNTSVTLQFGATQYSNVALSDVGALPANGNMPLRSSQQNATVAVANPSAAGQPAAATGNTLDSTQDKAASTADRAAQSVQKAKKTWGSILNSVNSVTH